MLQLVLVGAIGLVAGLSIGCIGVGGVVVVPVLVQLGGVPIHAAIGAALAGFVVTGIVGTAAFARRGSLAGRTALPVLVAAVPAAVLGALAAQAAPPILLELAIGLFTAGSGLHVILRGPVGADRAGATLDAPAGATVGAIAGFLSALTGTGGPAVLLPMLLWLDVPVLAGLGLAQVIQLPIAVPATLGNVWGGVVRWRLGLPLGLGLAVGTWGGAGLAHALDQALLRRLVAVVLLAVGLLMLGRVLLHLA